MIRYNFFPLQIAGESSDPIIQNIGRFRLMLGANLLGNLTHLLHPVCGHVFNASGHDVQIDISGILGPQTFLGANIQAERRRHHNQNHGAEDADGCKTCAIAFHAVNHGGNRNKMVGFVIKSLTFLQKPTERD